MKTVRKTGFILVHALIALMTGSAEAVAQAPASPATPESESPQSSSPATDWSFRASLYLLGSIERTDFLFSVFSDDPANHGAEPNVGLALENEGSIGGVHIRAGAFGLARGPFNLPHYFGSERREGSGDYFLAGRFRASVPLSTGWQLWFDDTAKAQRRAHVDVSNFVRNEFTGSAEWHIRERRGLSLQLSDRRRTSDLADDLSFIRQSARVGWFVPVGGHARADFGPVVQRYTSIAADGGRAGASADLAGFDRATVFSIHYTWLKPFGDRRHLQQPLQNWSIIVDPVVDPRVAQIVRTALLELFTLQGDDAELAGESFFLDPIESDSDEWDFGRTKHVAALFVSRQRTPRLTLSAFARYQHKHGANLLLPPAKTFDATDVRIDTRVTARYRLTSRLSLIAQYSYLRNAGDTRVFNLLGNVNACVLVQGDCFEPIANFHRTLAGVGLHVQF